MFPIQTLNLESNEELIYRGEGNSSLVVALQSKRQVIRLLKSDAKKLKNDDDVLSLLRLHIDFNVNILPEIIAHCFFTVPQLIRLELPQIERIKNLVKDKRPSFRLDKTISNCEYALLMPDYCCIPKSLSSYVNYCTVGSILSIEIKPKQGFLPQQSLFKNDANLSIKSKICRFGLSQFYKLQKQSIKSVSSYCPLDLFSGCPYRMFNALTCLIESPQNNFRVFCDAELCYGDQTHHDLMGKSVVNGENLKCVLEQFLNHRYSSGSAAVSAPDGLPQIDSTFSSQSCFLNYLRMYSLNQEVGSKSARLITSFCTLLMESLILSRNQSHNRHNLPNVINSNKNGATATQSAHTASHYCPTSVTNEFYKLDFSNEHAFFRTFIQMFDIDSSSVSCGEFTPITPIPPATATTTNNLSDLNNNQILTNGNGNPFRNLSSNLNKNRFSDSNGNIASVNEDFDESMMTNGNGNTNYDLNFNTNVNNNSVNLHQSVCHLHHETLSNLLPSMNASSCPCKDSLCHRLPSGCVLDTILSAQKLDMIDSAQAVRIFNLLCSRFKLLKQRLFPSNLTVPISDLGDDMFCRFVGIFVHENETTLDMLWRFLISLTAKDCSIMIAMQRVNDTNNNINNNINHNYLRQHRMQTNGDNNNSNFEILSHNNNNNNNGYPMAPLSTAPESSSLFITDPVTGHLYIVSVSITDLDYKQAYKIQRMLHNDCRMINAFRSAVLGAAAAAAAVSSGGSGDGGDNGAAAATAAGGGGNNSMGKSLFGTNPNSSTNSSSGSTSAPNGATSTNPATNLTKLVNCDDIISP